jgi:hypothetical protein
MKTPSRMSGNSTPPRGISASTTTPPGAPARPSALTIPNYTPSLANLNSPPRVVRRQLNFVGDPMNENTGDPLPANKSKNNKANDPSALKGGKRRRYTKKTKKTKKSKKSRKTSMKRK